MHRGYTLAWRKEKESAVWDMPYLYHRVWYWLRLTVNHAEKTLKTKKGTVTVLPGQTVTSLRQIAQGVSYRVEKGKTVTPNCNTIRRVLLWLECNGMISTKCNALGTVITIASWVLYATPKGVDVSDGKADTNQSEIAPSEVIHKHSEVTNKELKTKDLKTFALEGGDGGEKLETVKRRFITGKRLLQFNEFWDAFAYKKGKAAAGDSWLDIRNFTDALFVKIIAGAKREAATRPGLIKAGRTPKMAQGWLTESRWEDEGGELCKTVKNPQFQIAF